MSTTTLSSTRRRAAHGLHRCGACGGTIPNRDFYLDSRCAGGGHVWTWREHALCAELCDYAYTNFPHLEPEEWASVAGDYLFEWWQVFTLTFSGWWGR